MTMLHNNCPFCNDNRKKFLTENSYDVRSMYFYEDSDFSVSPDLSPLVTGHLLIIPSKHLASFGELTDLSILERMRQVTERLLGSDDLLIFEHGAVLEGEGGASVGHAHLHIMPRPGNMTVEKIDQYIKDAGCVATEKIKASHDVLHTFYKRQQPYIFYELSGQRYAYPVHAIPHQFLRFMLQPYCQISYNWRNTYKTEECRNNVRKTIEYVRTHRIY